MGYPSATRGGVTEPFELQVSKGEISFHTTYIKPGSIASQDTTEAIINSVGYIPAYSASAIVTKVSSGSVDDTSAGTGCRTVTITGLLSTYALASEVVTMNGQTAVNTVASYIRIVSITPLTFGGGGVSAGIIYAGTGTVTSGVPATVYLRCAAGAATNADLGPYLAPPLGYDLFLDGANLVAGISSNTATILIKYRLLTSATWTTFYSYVTTVNGSDYPIFKYPLRIPAGSEYCVTSDASATTISASCSVYGVYIGA
jgi:hypothetical protein